MADITSAISTANPRKIHIRRAAVQCISGPEAGESWLMERDVIRIGSAKTGDIVGIATAVSKRAAFTVTASNEAGVEARPGRVRKACRARRAPAPPRGSGCTSPKQPDFSSSLSSKPAQKFPVRDHDSDKET